MLKIYGIKNCSTMKKAFDWLDSHVIAYEFVDYKKPDVAAERLPAWVKCTGWEALLNRRGLTWKKLTDAERADVDEAKAIKLMSSYPSMIKRPVIETGSQLLVGFDADLYKKELSPR